MKKLTIAAVILLAVAAISSCKKNDHLPWHKAECRLTSYAVADLEANGMVTQYSKSYSYDKDGLLNREVVSLPKSNIGNEYLYDWGPNGKIISGTMNQLSGSDITFSSTLKFIYTGNFITSIGQYYEDYLISSLNIEYNSKGLVSSVSRDYGDNSPYNLSRSFEYNHLGQFTKITYKNAAGKITRVDKFNNAGQASPSAYTGFMKDGLQIDMPNAFTYPVADGGIGTKREIYTADASGNLKLVVTLQIKSKQLNADGHTQLLGWADESGIEVEDLIYGFDCNTKWRKN